MKKILIFPALALFMISCLSDFNIRKEITNSDVKKFKKSGIFIRFTDTTPIDKKKYHSTLGYWLDGYRKNNAIEIITDASDKITLFTSSFDSFNQMMEGSDFYKNKSLGVVKKFLVENEKEFKEIIDKKGLDSIILYEVDSNYSTEMQYITFSSILVIADTNFKVMYLDRQRDTFEVNEIDPELISRKLVDDVSRRLIECLDDFNYIR